MNKFSLKNPPANLFPYKKKAITFLSFQTEPFIVETQEGDMTISPETVDDWNEGYYIAYPEDGTKPYSIAKSYVDKNYEPILGRDGD